MKHFVIALSLFLSGAMLNTAWAISAKQQKRVAYVLKNIGVNADTQAKLKPLLVAYYDDETKAKSEYKKLKDKWQTLIDKQRLTAEQADKLLQAKINSETMELAVRKLYTTKFQTVLNAQKTYLCFDLLNDKMGKVEGKKSSSSDDEEDE